MEPVIRSLVLKRFRSIPSEAVDLANPTFLVGQNGSGKSNFVDAFAFLAEAMGTPLQAVFDNRDGISAVRNRTPGRSYPPNLGLAVRLGEINGEITGGNYAFEVRALPNYAFEVVREQCSISFKSGQRGWFDRKGMEFKSNVPGLAPSLDPASLGLPVVGGHARFAPILRTLSAMRVYSIEPAQLREMQEADSGLGLKPDGSNAASVLREIARRANGDIDRIGEILATIVPNTTNVGTSKHGKKLSLEFTQEWGQKKRLKFEAFSMSDGTLRALGLLTAVFQHPVPSLMVVEEPEARIHPGALGAVLDVLRTASRRMQIVVTTNSPEVLDAKWIGEPNLRIVTWQEGASHVTGLSEPSRQALVQHLMGAGELLRSNALTAPPFFHDTMAQDELFEALP
jgi:predicted ATPase